MSLGRAPRAGEGARCGLTRSGVGELLLPELLDAAGVRQVAQLRGDEQEMHQAVLPILLDEPATGVSQSEVGAEVVGPVLGHVDRALDGLETSGIQGFLEGLDVVLDLTLGCPDVGLLLLGHEGHFSEGHDTPPFLCQGALQCAPMSRVLQWNYLLIIAST